MTPIEEVEVAELLESLVDRSLIGFDAGAGRYAITESVREYARELAASQTAGREEAASCHQRFLDYFLTLAGRAAPNLRSHDQVKWLIALRRDHDNLRSALTHLIETGDGGRALQLADDLGGLWFANGEPSEGLDWLNRALAMEGGEPGRRASAHIRCGSLAFWRRDVPASRAHYQEALCIGRETDDPGVMAAATNGLGTLWLEHDGDPEKAEACFREALDLAREAGERPLQATVLSNLGDVYRHRGEWDGAARLYAEAADISREIGDQFTLAFYLCELAFVLLEQGFEKDVRPLFEESLQCARAVGDPIQVATTLLGMALLYHTCSNTEEAAGHAAEIQGLFLAESARCGVPMLATNRLYFDRLTAQLQDQLGEEAYNRHKRVGRELTVELAAARVCRE